MNDKKRNKAQPFDKSILRAYDIRGEWQKTLRLQDAYAIGYTLATTWRKGTTSQILVARDGRASSPALSQALLQGLGEGGVTGIDLGVLPTPALYFAEACRDKNPPAEGAGGKGAGNVVGAVMVTGSHNPPQHNGFKLVREGKPFFGQELQDLAEDLAESIATAPPMLSSPPSSPPSSSPSSSPSPSGQDEDNDEDFGSKVYRESYIQRLLEEDARYEGGKLASVWDMGGGAGCVVTKDLVPRLQGEHRLLFAEIDSSFKARSPDPGKPHALDKLREEVLRDKAQIGLAFDGDADRLVVLTSQGKRLSGDRLLFLFATDLLQSRNSVEQARDSAPLILCDIKTSPSVLRAIERLGGRTELVQTGHAHIKRALALTGAEMAGEVSGHLFFNDRYGGYDDALYAAVRLCAMVRSGFEIEHALSALPPSVSSDELRLPIEEDRKFTLVEDIQAVMRKDLATRTGKEAYSLCTLDGVRVERTDGSWWLLRASNTEAALVLRVEAREAAACRAVLGQIETLLARHGYRAREPLADTPLVDG